MYDHIILSTDLEQMREVEVGPIKIVFFTFSSKHTVLTQSK